METELEAGAQAPSRLPHGPAAPIIAGHDEHDPSNPIVLGLPIGVLIAALVSLVAVAMTLVKFLGLRILG